MKCLSSGSLIMADKRQACLHYVGVYALPEDMVGPHDVIMASCDVSGAAALSDKITIVSFIEDDVAQEVKRRFDIKAAAMATEEDLQLCLKLSVQYHSTDLCGCMCSTS